ISSSLNTAINGGSFKDNLTNALLANIGSQVQAEGANLIGDNGDVLGAAGKSVSHAVVVGIAAEIGHGDGKGAAAGALAAELAGVIINDNLVRSEGWQERQAQISRVAGAFAGALATGKANGANSGANAAEVVERFNRQLHLDELNAIKELAKGDKEKEARLLAASCRQVNCTAQESLSSEERVNYEALMEKYKSTKYEDQLLANYWVLHEKQRYGNYPLYPEMELSQLFTYTESDKLNDGSDFVLNQWIENASKFSGLSKEAVKGAAILLSTAGVVLEASRGGRSKPIVFDGKFYSADDFKSSKEYYERLWGQGRPAPFLQAREIMNSKPKVVADPRGAPGYFKYEGAGLEMIYNPSTKQVGHIQPMRNK
ncbi:DUF637 domain-containing protein, partial [Serratia marcescens]|nr:DUF637 domain-containing protein [Serratia marcescens]